MTKLNLFAVIASLVFLISLVQAGSGNIKNDLSEVAANFEAHGLTKLCLANISNDATVRFKVHAVADAAVAYIRKTANPKLSNEQVVDVVNIALLNSIVYERGIDKRCANVTDGLIGQKRAPAPEATDIATVGRLSLQIGTTLECLVRKPTPIFPQLVQGLRNGLQGIVTDDDPSKTSMAIFATHLTTLSESYIKLVRNCF